MIGVRQIAVWLCLLIAPLTFAATDVHPNIIFILADDLGPGDIGCYGGTLAKTPNIDQLAKEGTRFDQYYVASPVCSPSRCALITGQFPARWRITSYLAEKSRNRGAEMADFLDPKAPSLPRQLKNAGYRTAHFGKWHLGGGRDVTDAPKFAAYGYDEHAGTYEARSPTPISRQRIGSGRRKINSSVGNARSSLSTKRSTFSAETMIGRASSTFGSMMFILLGYRTSQPKRRRIRTSLKTLSPSYQKWTSRSDA